MINKAVIDVEIDELARKESSHLDNLSFDLATQARLPATKRQNRSSVQENKKIPVKMLKKNIKIEKWFVLFQSENCTRLYFCFYFVMLFFWKTFGAFNCMYWWTIFFVIFNFFFQNINLKFLFMNYISYCSILFRGYFCSDKLLAESNCVDIILYYQHHIHLSYMNDDVNSSLKRKPENNIVFLEFIEEDIWREILKRINYWLKRR